MSGRLVASTWRTRDNLARVTGPDETERAGAEASVFFVQLLYRRGREARWVTAAIGDRRDIAVRRAAELYRNLAAPDGRLPQAVRVRSEAELVALDGEEGLERALDDLNPGVLAAVAPDGA